MVFQEGNIHRLYFLGSIFVDYRIEYILRHQNLGIKVGKRISRLQSRKLNFMNTKRIFSSFGRNECLQGRNSIAHLRREVYLLGITHRQKLTHSRLPYSHRQYIDHFAHEEVQLDRHIYVLPSHKSKFSCIPYRL